MSARATWKGFLKISLVTIPVKVYPATESSAGLDFNQLHADCQSRISQRKWCANCAREVTSAEIVKGFEFATGQYVILLPEELDAVQPPSTKVIDLVHVAPAAQLDPLFIDRSYYVGPDGEAAGEALAVLRVALSGLVAIGKLAIYGREYLVAVRNRGGTLLLHTLHHAAEIRSAAEIEIPEARHGVRDPEVRLARQVVAALRGPLDLFGFTDQYRADLRRLIDAKIAGEEIVIPTVEAPAVGNLRDALVQSLAAVKATLPRRKQASA